MKILTVIGTRPDAIKLLPVHFALKELGIQSVLCATSQHITMLDQVLGIFGVVPDIDLKVMIDNQNLFYLTNTILAKMEQVLIQEKPDLVIVQGDTTTAFATATAAFYLKIPIAHVEAGLRTGSLYAPFPEEMNRRFVGMVAHYHFAATSLNVANLLAEGVSRDTIILTGNTVVDALHMVINKIESKQVVPSDSLVTLVKQLKQSQRRIALLTAHRREAFDGGLHNIFRAAQAMLSTHKDLAILYPHHPNPHVLRAIQETGLSGTENLFMMSPLSYVDLVFALQSSDWVATDSGGVQEEAMSLGKPVVVLRERTERIEGVWEGIGHLAGTESDAILQYMNLVHTKKKRFSSSNIYGDGQASKKIASFIDAIRQREDAAVSVSMTHCLRQKPYDNYTNN